MSNSQFVGVEMEIVDDMQISLFASSVSVLEEFKKEIDSIANTQGVVILLSVGIIFPSISRSTAGASTRCYIQCYHSRRSREWTVS